MRSALDENATLSDEIPMRAQDWDGAWREFRKAQPDKTPPTTTQGVTKPLPLSSGSTGFRFAASESTQGRDTMLSLFSSDAGFMAAAAVLGVFLAFYLYVGATGGITDGYDRFSAPDEELAATLSREASVSLQ